MTSPHPLLRLLTEAASGSFPPVDGGVTVLPAAGDGVEAIVAFTGHAVFATDLPEAEVHALHPDGFGGAMAPAVMLGLAGERGWVGGHDVTLAGAGTGGGALPRRGDLDDHHRVRLARSIRTDVTVYGDDRGLVITAVGIGGRAELSIELFPELQGARLGAELLRDGLALFDAGQTVFAAVAPGNARSLRLFLRHGFTPLASEVVIRPARAAGRKDA